ncbi:hypothetical protein Y900_007435 [Mycolicibacterium aromaticivorans JS19b1 = JCM 16368]|uniref:Uncharacterized protein n=2 Tax=Mycolicibacterium aromaticivorans TaxID=318425 RepID=A0A064CJ44_9MYCO|nr:hypothetical protein Y900_007435 [Mycolicibacterium aromaticivorans JS19b1 = JCM 16368]
MSASTASALAYVLLVMGFAALGLLVGALATGSAVAVAFFVGLVACLAGSVMGFRTASRKLSKSEAFDEATSPVSIFSAPLPQEQIDRYLENYRPQRRVTHSSNTRSNRDVVTVTPLQPKYRAVA